MEASVGMRKTVPSLKFKENEALSKWNLKDREGTTILPLRENEIAANFVAIVYIKMWCILLRGDIDFQNLANWCIFCCL